ncbi:MAG: hypothetical protein CMJ78_20150 [Planctomycetaceae bacterium]|nr:hypothetical protein [Planctomycetaceae bacterium]
MHVQQTGTLESTEAENSKTHVSVVWGFGTLLFAGVVAATGFMQWWKLATATIYTRPFRYEPTFGYVKVSSMIVQVSAIILFGVCVTNQLLRLNGIDRPIGNGLVTALIVSVLMLITAAIAESRRASSHRQTVESRPYAHQVVLALALLGLSFLSWIDGYNVFTKIFHIDSLLKPFPIYVGVLIGCIALLKRTRTWRIDALLLAIAICGLFFCHTYADQATKTRASVGVRLLGTILVLSLIVADVGASMVSWYTKKLTVGSDRMISVGLILVVLLAAISPLAMAYINMPSIFYAARKGYYGTINRHIKQGVDVNSKDENGMNALMWVSVSNAFNQ